MATAALTSQKHQFLTIHPLNPCYVIQIVMVNFVTRYATDLPAVLPPC
jgi:3-hydroxyacyl-CoA dehydrogenase